MNDMQEYSLEFSATAMVYKPDGMTEAELVAFAKEKLTSNGMLGVTVLRLDATPSSRN